MDCEQAYFEPHNTYDYHDLPCDTNNIHHQQKSSLEEALERLTTSTLEFQQERRAGYNEAITSQPVQDIYEEPVNEDCSEEEADEGRPKNFQNNNTWTDSQPPRRLPSRVPEQSEAELEGAVISDEENTYFREKIRW